MEMWPIDRPRPYERNPRRNDAAVEKVAASIREFGWDSAIVVDRDGVIIAGHTRLKAAKRLGLAEVPVIVRADLTDEQARALRLADNKTGEFAEWDEALLGDELAALAAAEVDMEQFGFGGVDIDFEAFDGDGDGGGSRLQSGSGCRVCIGPHITDIKEDGDECYQRAAALTPERIAEFIHDALMNGDLQ